MGNYGRTYREGKGYGDTFREGTSDHSSGSPKKVLERIVSAVKGAAAGLIRSPESNLKAALAAMTSEQVRKQEVIAVLTRAFGGLHREGFDDVELETKLDLSETPEAAAGKGGAHAVPEMRAGERVDIPAPYARDKILEESNSLGRYYGRTHDLSHAFTVVEHAGGAKIKGKSAPRFEEIQGITVIERREINRPIDEFKKGKPKHADIDAEVESYGRSLERAVGAKLTYVAGVMRTNKECFVLNPVSGRVFVVETHKAVFFPEFPGQNIFLDARLHQIEVEYHGTLKGLKSDLPLKTDLALLTRGIMENLPAIGYVGLPSVLTKYVWAKSQISRSFK